MRKSIFVGIGLALSVAGTAIAQAPQDGKRPARGERGTAGAAEGRQGGPDGMLLKGITLSEGQRTQIAQLRATQREQMKARGQQGRGQAGDVRAARERGDTAALRKAMEQRHAALQQERSQHVAAIRNLLTADQRVQFDKNEAELTARQAERGDRAKRGPGGKGQARGGRAPGRIGR